MSDETQALCFLAGANSIFYGEKLLTTGNPDVERDRQLFARLGLKPEQRPAQVAEADDAASRSNACAHTHDTAAANA
jgi:biotin synthase